MNYQCDHGEPCGCYAEGYAQGKDKAYSEVRTALNAGNHSEVCGCEPCKLLRDVRQVQERRELLEPFLDLPGVQAAAGDGDWPTAFGLANAYAARFGPWD